MRLGLFWRVRPAGKRCVTGDKPRAAFVGDIRPGPLDQNDDAVTEADQKEDVHE